MTTKHEWENILSKIVKEQETFPASWSAFYTELKAFISSERQKAYEEGRGVKENITTLKNKAYEEGYKDGNNVMNDQDAAYEAGRQAAYTELLADAEYFIGQGGNSCLSAIRDLIEKKLDKPNDR